MEKLLGWGQVKGGAALDVLGRKDGQKDDHRGMTTGDSREVYGRTKASTGPFPPGPQSQIPHEGAGQTAPQHSGPFRATPRNSPLG